MKIEHPYAEWLRAIADGEVLQYRYTADADRFWYSEDQKVILGIILGDETHSGTFRIKPKTIMIGDYEVPAPCDYIYEYQNLKQGLEYYFIDFSRINGVEMGYWEADFTDIKLLQRGIWLIREDAELAAKATFELISGTKK